jgi:hypothetical protein
MQATVPEEMSPTLLTNKKQGKITKHTLLTLLSQVVSHVLEENC